MEDEASDASTEEGGLADLLRRQYWSLPVWAYIVIVAGTVVVGVFAFLGDEDDSPSAASGDDGSGAALVEVEYFVEGTADSVDITYSTASGDIAQQSSVQVPLRREDGGDRGISLGRVRPGTPVYISAQNNGGHGSVICSIESDGVQVAETESSGAYVIAQCSGRA